MRKSAALLAAVALALLSLLVPLGSQASAVLAVTVFIVALWIAELLPLHVTALLAAVMLIVFARLPEKEIFANFFDPVIVLLFGGFALALAITKHKLDMHLACRIMGRFGSRSRYVLLGLMLSTAAISMWISNTAAAAIMMPIAVVILARNGMKALKSNFGKAAVLGVAYGATIGGIGTIVGSTPNIMAAKYLNNGSSFGFFDWFYRGFPFMLAMVIVGWLILLVIFRPEKQALRMPQLEKKLGRQQKTLLVVFGITILLWVTESFHGISNASVSVFAVVMLYVTGLLNSEDFLKLDWPSLVLVGGGLALGYAIHASSLDALFISALKITGGFNPLALFLVLGLFGVLLTSFVSNTTASAVYLPIVVALASSFGASPANAVVAAALGVSLDFIFPFGTPPSAIAYSTKYVRMKDMAKAGIAISAAGIAVLAAFAMLW